MLAPRDNLQLSADAIGAHKLRVALTVLGLTMGVATLITVMTLVQGANVYVERKIANLGTNVFRMARTPFLATDFTVVVRALRNKYITLEDMQAVAEQCTQCQIVGATVSTTVNSVKYKDQEIQDATLYGYTANMVDIDTRTVETGRYFTEPENRHAAPVCLIGSMLVDQFFPAVSPLGRTIRVGADEFTVIGTFEKIGAVLGQEQDNFVLTPMNKYLRVRGSRTSITLEVKAAVGAKVFQAAQDEAATILRTRRHVPVGQPDDFFIGTAQSYISLWQSISSAFFAVFVLVSSISAVVGGIVIMNVMLVSVTERTKEIGVRRAVGATQRDILKQFLTESVLECIAGGVVGIVIGFLCALGLRTFTSFPASVRTWVALLGVFLSTAIGMFFGIYPAVKASRLDPVAALRSD